MDNTNPLQHHTRGDIVSRAEAENAIEIAMNCLETLQEHLDMGRDAIIRNYILPWAQEAEQTWNALHGREAPDDTDIPYYDFIDDFSAKKEAAFLQGQLP